jgi:hemerythrin
MALISWKRDYSVKVIDVDNEHKMLVGLVNTLHDAMIVGKANEVMSSILRNWQIIT